MGLPKITLAESGERAQYLVHEFNDNTIRFVLNYRGLVQPEILCEATKALVESVDILHGTFFYDGVSAYWHINENVDQNLYFQYVPTAGDPRGTAYALAVLPVYPGDKVQMRCTLVQSSMESSVVLCISHLCVDGSDGKYLLGKLTEAYDLILENGSADGLEIKNGSRSPEKAYEKLGFKDKKSLLTNPLSTVEMKFPYPSEELGMVRMVHKNIPAEIMGAARKRGKQTGATVNDLLLTACYHAYAALQEVDASAAMSLTSMIDLRRHCKDGESEGLCNMSGALPTTLQNGICDTFEATLAEVVQQTTAVKENPFAGLEGVPLLYGVARTVPIWLLLSLVGKVYGSMSVGLTNLGNLSCADFAMEELVPTGGVFGGPLKKKPGMQVSIISFDGECVLSVVGQYTKADSTVLQNMLDKMSQEIEEYAEEK